MANGLTPRTLGLLGLGGGLLTAQPNYGAFSPGQGITAGLGQYQAARNFELLQKRNRDMQRYREAMSQAALSDARIKARQFEFEQKKYSDLLKELEKLGGGAQDGVIAPSVAGTTPQGAVVQMIPSANAKLYAKGLMTDQLWDEALDNTDRQYLGDNAQMDSQMYSPGVNYGEGPQVGMAGTIAQLPIDPGGTVGMQTQQTPTPVTPQYQQRPPQMPSFALDPFEQQMAATQPAAPEPQSTLGAARKRMTEDQMTDRERLSAKAPLLTALNPDVGRAVTQRAGFLQDEAKLQLDQNKFAAEQLGLKNLPSGVYSQKTPEGFRFYEKVKNPDGSIGENEIDSAEVQRRALAKSRAGAPRISLKVGDSYWTAYGKSDAEGMQESRTKAIESADAIRTIHESRKLLDSGMFSGLYGDVVTNFNRAIVDLGFNQHQDKVANTQAYAANIGNLVGAVIKQFGAGTGLSDADREYAQRIAGGDTALDELAIRKLLDIQERVHRVILGRHNKDAQLVDEHISTLRSRGEDIPPIRSAVIPEPPDYQKPPTTTETRDSLREKYGFEPRQ